MGCKLVFIVLKVSIALGKESLKGPLISLIRSRLIYFISLSLLNHIKGINFLLELGNLVYHFLGRVFVITSGRGGGGLRSYYIFILFS